MNGIESQIASAENVLLPSASHNVNNKKIGGKNNFSALIFNSGSNEKNVIDNDKNTKKNLVQFKDLENSQYNPVHIRDGKEVHPANGTNSKIPSPATVSSLNTKGLQAGIKTQELYEQKFYATGKLSYVEMSDVAVQSQGQNNTKSFVVGAEVGQPAQRFINEHEFVNLQQMQSQAERSYALVVSSSASMQSDRIERAQFMARYAKTDIVEKRKVTENICDDNHTVMVRDYHSPLDELNSAVSYLASKLKLSIKFIINGRVR